MMLLADAASPALMVLASVLVFTLMAGGVALAWRPVGDWLRWQEMQFDHVLRHRLLIDVAPRTATTFAVVATVVLALLFYLGTGTVFGLLIGVAIGVVVPMVLLRLLVRRRRERLEGQLVNGVHMLASGVRAGLNLIQSMELLARDGPDPIRQEFAHMLREYEYGMSLEQAMANAAERIGSNDYELLMAALRTHRERGGDLGATLDRIAESLREIQRLENQVRTLTAQGRATARWLGAMPGVIMLLLFLMVDSQAVGEMFVTLIGRLILTVILILNIIGFFWIRRVMSVDI